MEGITPMQTSVTCEVILCALSKLLTLVADGACDSVSARSRFKPCRLIHLRLQGGRKGGQFLTDVGIGGLLKVHHANETRHPNVMAEVMLKLGILLAEVLFWGAWMVPEV